MEFFKMLPYQGIPVPDTNKNYIFENGCLYRRRVLGKHTRQGWTRRETFRSLKPKLLSGKLYFEIWLKGKRKCYTVEQLADKCKTIEF